MTVSLNMKLAGLSPTRRRKVEARAAELILEFSMGELRKARALTQKDVAKRLRIKQANVSKLEQRSDMMLSTLRSYVEAIGGNLDLVVYFEGQKPVRLGGLRDIARVKGASPRGSVTSKSRTPKVRPKAGIEQLSMTAKQRRDLAKLIAVQSKRPAAKKGTRTKGGTHRRSHRAA